MFASLAAPSLTESMILPELNAEGHFFWKCESVTILVFGKVVGQQSNCRAWLTRPKMICQSKISTEFCKTHKFKTNSGQRTIELKPTFNCKNKHKATL